MNITSVLKKKGKIEEEPIPVKSVAEFAGEVSHYIGIVIRNWVMSNIIRLSPRSKTINDSKTSFLFFY